jgi:hypothetical protein
MSAIDELNPALAEIGAHEFERKVSREGGDDIETRYFLWGNRLIAVSEGNRDGVGCKISDTGATPNSPEDSWHAIFETTVPGFATFNDDDRIDWILSVPSGQAYTKFLIEHIRLLKP